MTLRLGDLLVTAQVYDPDIADRRIHLAHVDRRGGPGAVDDRALDVSDRRAFAACRKFRSVVSFAFDELAIDQPGAPTPALLRAKHAELHGRIAEGSVADKPVIEVVNRLTGATLPSVHPLLGQPLDADITSRLFGLRDFSPKPWPARFREIQAADGRIEIVQARVQQGDLIATATGQLGLTPAGRLNGELQMVVAGIEKIVPALGLDKLLAQGVPQSTVDRFAPGVNARDVNNVLGSLDKIIPGLGNLARERAGTVAVAGINALGQPTTLEGKRAIALPLRFVDGAVFIGLLQVGQTPTLF